MNVFAWDTQVPSLENWGGGLKSLLWLANSPHVQYKYSYHTITLSSDTQLIIQGPCLDSILFCPCVLYGVRVAITFLSSLYVLS